MPRSIPGFLSETAERLPEKTAIVSPAAIGNLFASSTTRRWRRRSACANSASRRAIASASAWRSRSIRCPRSSVCLFANAVVVPILPRLKQPNIRHIIENSRHGGDDHRHRAAEGGRRVRRHRPQLITGHGEIDQQLAQSALPAPLHAAAHVLRPDRQRQRGDHLLVGFDRSPEGDPDRAPQPRRRRRHRCRVSATRVEDDRIGCVLSFNFDYGSEPDLADDPQGRHAVSARSWRCPTTCSRCSRRSAITALPVMPVIITKMFDKRLKLGDDRPRFFRRALRVLDRRAPVGGHDRTTCKIDVSGGEDLLDVRPDRGVSLDLSGSGQAGHHPTSIGKAIPGLPGDGARREWRGMPAECRRRTGASRRDRHQGLLARPREHRQGLPHPSAVSRRDAGIQRRQGVPRRGGLPVLRRARRRHDQDARASASAPPRSRPKWCGIRTSSTRSPSPSPTSRSVRTSAAPTRPSSGKPLPEHSLKQYLKTQLPSHMVPAYLLHFDSFPDHRQCRQVRSQARSSRPPSSVSARAAGGGGRAGARGLNRYGDSPSGARIVIGVIGDDIHVVGNRIMQLALEESGFRVFNLRTRNRPEHFCEAALEVNAHAVFVSSLNGEGEHWCADFRAPLRCDVGLRPRAALRRRQCRRRQRPDDEVVALFKQFGFDRVYHQQPDISVAIADLHEDLRHGKARR